MKLCTLTLCRCCGEPMDNSNRSRMNPNIHTHCEASEMVKQCAWCKKLWDWNNKRWVDSKDMVLDGLEVTHGICEDCKVEQLKKLEAM